MASAAVRNVAAKSAESSTAPPSIAARAQRGEHDLRRTFAIEHRALRRRMHRREPLALRVERDLVHARAVRQRRHRIGGELDERNLHRIAEPAGSGGGARVFQIVAARRHFKKRRCGSISAAS